MKARSFVVVLCASSLMACSAVLGFETLTLGPTETGPGDATTDGSPTVETGTGGEGGTTEAGSEGGPSEAGDDGGPCTADAASDPSNCGRCGHDCNGGQCVSGQCQAIKLADGLGYPEGIAVDDTTVYVAEMDQNRILKLDKTKASGCQSAPSKPSCVFEEDQSNVFQPITVGVDGDTVFWANGGSNSNAEIRSCPKTGCGASAAATVASLGNAAFEELTGAAVPLHLIFRNGRIYWSENGTGKIRTALTDGTDQKLLLSNPTFWPVQVAVDDNAVYFTDNSNQHVTRIAAVPHDGGGVSGVNPHVIGTTPARPWGIVLQDDILYWTVPQGDAVQAVSTAGMPDGGEVVGALATPLDPADIAVDADNVYWTQVGDDSSATGMIAYCPRTGCNPNPVVLADQQNRPRHIVVDDKAIYWSNVGLISSQTYDGQVWMIAKP